MRRRLDLPLLVLGLGAGLALAWVLAGPVDGVRTAPPASPNAAQPEADAPATEVTPVGPRAARENGPSAGRIGLAEALRDAPPEEVHRALLDEGLVIDEAGVAAIVGLIEAARRDRDGELFADGILALARAKRRDARVALLELARDETLVFPTTLGRHFREALAEADLPGIAGTARRRIERNVAAGNTSWTAVDGWMELVATHGGLEDLEWLLACISGARFEGEFGGDAAEHLARIRHPDALDRIEARLRDGDLEHFRPALWGLVEHHPRRAHAVVEHLLDRTELPERLTRAELMRAYGRTLPASDLEAARRRLLALRTAEERTAAVRAVIELARRGLDVSGLEPVLRGPLEVLASLQDGDQSDLRSPRRGYHALYAIQGCKALWTEETAAILELAGERLRRHPKSRLMVLLRKIRAHLASPWKTR